MSTMRKMLTPRQCDVMEHVAAGLNYMQVARAMNVSEATIKTTMRMIGERLVEDGVNRTALAVRWVTEAHAAVVRDTLESLDDLCAAEDRHGDTIRAHEVRGAVADLRTTIEETP